MKPRDERRTVKLTKTTVERMEPGETLWDSELVGFGARRRNYRPSYLVKYGAGRRGRSRWLTIGKHGGAWLDETGKPCYLTAELARKEALRLLGERARGNDPAAARARVRKLPTLEEFAARYLKEYSEAHKKPSSQRQDRQSIKALLPALGRLRIDRITGADVSRWHAAQRHRPASANRDLSLLSAMLTMAETWGLRARASNPCRDVKRFRMQARRRYLSEGELARVGVALSELEEKNPMAVNAVRLALFIGARRNEVRKLKWSEVNFDRAVLELEDSKTGQKDLPLNAPALQLLSSLPRIAGTQYVFPGRGVATIGVNRTWEMARERAGIPDVRLHDLRHSFASILVSGGASLPLIGGLLGHSNPKTTARYAHLSNDPLRAASERAGEAIVAAMKRGAAK